MISWQTIRLSYLTLFEIDFSISVHVIHIRHCWMKGKSCYRDNLAELSRSELYICIHRNSTNAFNRQSNGSTTFSDHWQSNIITEAIYFRRENMVIRPHATMSHHI